MTSKELEMKTPEELRKLAQELRESVRDLRFKIATRQHLKVRTVREVKKDLARVTAAIASKSKTN